MRKRVLVIQTAFLGDAILTLPLIQVIQKKIKNTIIDVVAIEATKEIFESSPFVNETIVLKKKKQEKSLVKTIQFAYKLKRKKYDIIYSPHRSFRTSLIVFLSGVKETYGFNNASFSFVYKYQRKYNPNIHEVARNISLFDEDLINKKWNVLPECRITEREEIKVSKLLSSLPNINKTIAIAPGSVWETKKYPTNYYIEIINYLILKSYNVILLGGINDAQLCQVIEKEVKDNILNLTGKLSITESIAIISKSDLIICNDSAPTHMAMCADAKVLTIYCSTVPEFGFYPYNNASQYISYDELDCKPCGIHGHNSCPVETFDCGKKLLPELVIKKLENMLESNKVSES